MKPRKTDEERAAEAQATADLRRELERLIPQLAATILPGATGGGQGFIATLAGRLAEGGWRYPATTTLHALEDVLGHWNGRLSSLFAGKVKTMPTPDERSRIEAVFADMTADLLTRPRPADKRAWASDIERQVEEGVARLDGEPMEDLPGKALAVVNELKRRLCAFRGAARKHLPEAIRRAGGSVP